MRHLGYLPILALVIAGQAHGQAACTAPHGDVDPCMVGTFHGQSDMAARLELLLSGMPEDIRAQAMEGTAESLFLRIRADGTFLTSPMTGGVEAVFLGESGDIGTLRAQLEAHGGIGQFSRTGGDGLAWCMISGGFGTVAVWGDEAGTVAPVASPNPVDPVPMRYVCEGPAMKLFVDLPPPFGTVTYSMERVTAPPEVFDLFFPEP